MKNKVIALMLVLAMSMTMIACGQDEPQKESEQKSEVEESTDKAEESESQEVEEEKKVITFPLEEQITVTAVSRYSGDGTKVSEKTGWHTHNEDTNINFELTEILEDEFAEKLNLMFASDEYPDVFYRADVDTAKYGVSEGILIPLEDLIREYCPNLTALLDNSGLWGSITSSDGHVYGLPSFGKQAPSLWWLHYNQKWLDNLDLDVPTNMDEFYDVLKAFKEEDANGNGDPDDEIPFTASYNGFALITAFGFLFQDGIADNGTLLTYQGADYKEVGYMPATENYKELLAFFAKCYAEGLLDANAFIQPYDTLYAEGVNGNYGFFAAHNLGGADHNKEYYQLPPFEGVEGFSVTNGIAFPNTFSITDKCEYPEEIMAWVDFWYSEEGSIMANYGVEGVDYEYDEEGYMVQLPEATGTMQIGMYIPINYNAELSMKGWTKENHANGWLKQYNLNNIDLIGEYGFIPPTIVVAESNVERKADLETSLREYVDAYIAAVVTGEKDLDSTWDEYTKQLETIGLTEYLEICVASMPEGYAVAK